jgi:hypothetical protein
VWLWCCIEFSLRGGEEDNGILVKQYCRDSSERSKNEKGARWLHELIGVCFSLIDCRLVVVNGIRYDSLGNRT